MRLLKFTRAFFGGLCATFHRFFLLGFQAFFYSVFTQVFKKYSVSKLVLTRFGKSTRLGTRLVYFIKHVLDLGYSLGKKYSVFCNTVLKKYSVKDTQFLRNRVKNGQAGKEKNLCSIFCDTCRRIVKDHGHCLSKYCCRRLDI